MIRRGGVPVLLLLLVMVLAGCPGRGPRAASLPVAFGLRVNDGRLQVSTGLPCSGLTRMALYFKPSQAQLLLTSRAPEGVEVERLTLGGPYPAGLTVSQPLPAGFDWHKERTVDLVPSGGSSHRGASVDLAEAVKGSPAHPDDTFWFRSIGWLTPAEVAAKDGKTFLGLCTPDPAKKH